MCHNGGRVNKIGGNKKERTHTETWVITNQKGQRNGERVLKEKGSLGTGGDQVKNGSQGAERLCGGGVLI